MKSRVAVLAFAVLLSAQSRSLDWIHSPEGYFATREERTEWQKNVLTPADAQRFIAAFWEKRGEAFHKEVRSRIDRADDLFRLAGTRGSMTARGRVWMILGSPWREQMMRYNTVEATLPATLPNVLQNNPVERGAVVSTRWTYNRERLPPALGVPELVIDFQTNTSRGQEVIENPGLIEPYLLRMVETFAAHGLAPAVAVPSTGSDPLWKAPENLAGSFFTGEAYIAATEKPFYAISFYVPRAASAFANLQSVLFVAVVRGEDGKDVAAVREQLTLKPYGSGGDRYIDYSLALAAGNYSASFALFTPEGSAMLANRRVSIRVPAPTDRGVSRLLPTGFIERGDKQHPLEPFSFVATKYAVKGDHHFTVNDRVGFFTVVANPAGDPEPSLVMTMKILRDGKVLHETQPEPASLTQTGPHTWLIGPLFEPGAFPPGRYDIELSIKDAKGSGTYSAKTDFRVE